MNLPRGISLDGAVTAQSLLLGFVGGAALAFPKLLEFLLADQRWSQLWLPLLGTYGQSVTYYLWLAQLLQFLVVPVGALAVGVRATRRLELVERYRSLVASVALGSGVGYAVGYAALGLSFDAPAAVLLLGGLWAAAGRALVFSLVAFAGAAYAEIRHAASTRDADSETA